MNYAKNVAVRVIGAEPLQALLCFDHRFTEVELHEVLDIALGVTNVQDGRVIDPQHLLLTFATVIEYCDETDDVVYEIGRRLRVTPKVSRNCTEADQTQQVFNEIVQLVQDAEWPDESEDDFSGEPAGMSLLDHAAHVLNNLLPELTVEIELGSKPTGEPKQDSQPGDEPADGDAAAMPPKDGGKSFLGEAFDKAAEAAGLPRLKLFAKSPVYGQAMPKWLRDGMFRNNTDQLSDLLGKGATGLTEVLKSFGNEGNDKQD